MHPRETDKRTRIAIAIAFALGAATIIPAQAQQAQSGVQAMPTSDTGWSICNGGGCRWGTGDPPNPYVRAVPQPQTDEDRKALAERTRLWTDRCKPTTHFDKYGVERATYAAEGCEFGQTR